LAEQGEVARALWLYFVVIGEIGTGKSSFCNLVTGRKDTDPDAFPVSDDTGSCTAVPEAKEGECEQHLIRALDTPGAGSKTATCEQILNSVYNFVQATNDRPNVIVLTMNIHVARLTKSVISMLRRFANVLKNPETWNHVIVVFTHCFHDPRCRTRIPDKWKKRSSRVCGQIVEIVRETLGNEGIDFTPEPFFVDLANDDDILRGELRRLFACAYGRMQPLPQEWITVPGEWVRISVDVPKTDISRSVALIEQGTNLPEVIVKAIIGSAGGIAGAIGTGLLVLASLPFAPVVIAGGLVALGTIGAVEIVHQVNGRVYDRCKVTTTTTTYTITKVTLYNGREEFRGPPKNVVPVTSDVIYPIQDVMTRRDGRWVLREGELADLQLVADIPNEIIP
jgi:hypothetical protein